MIAICPTLAAEVFETARDAIAAASRWAEFETLEWEYEIRCGGVGRWRVRVNELGGKHRRGYVTRDGRLRID